MQGAAENPLAEQASDAILGANPFVGIDPQQLVGDLARSIGALATRPRRVASEAARIGRELGGIIAGDSSPAPANGDKRFSDVAWTENPVYRRLGQGYLTLVAGWKVVALGLLAMACAVAYTGGPVPLGSFARFETRSAALAVKSRRTRS